ncbi:MAG: hypothetical protein QOJ85_2719 [Solirubrobacteraceae bacterium]|jgi:hypothetical protein|nr:hypothetical protein [Solirubrobacteraceae bacterium]
MHGTATISGFERPGLSLVVPEGTDVLCEQPLVLALPAAAGVQARYVLETRSADAALDSWLSEQMASQLRLLELPLLLSQERCEVFGNDGWRTLLHHAVEGRAVTVVQWWTVVDGCGVIASASCWTPQFDLLADTFRDIQERVRFDDE